MIYLSKKLDCLEDTNTLGEKTLSQSNEFLLSFMGILLLAFKQINGSICVSSTELSTLIHEIILFLGLTSTLTIGSSISIYI